MRIAADRVRADAEQMRAAAERTRAAAERMQLEREIEKNHRKQIKMMEIAERYSTNEIIGLNDSDFTEVAKYLDSSQFAFVSTLREKEKIQRERERMQREREKMQLEREKMQGERERECKDRDYQKGFNAGLVDGHDNNKNMWNSQRKARCS